MEDQCHACGSDTDEHKYQDSVECPQCGTRYAEDYIEFRDVIVRLWDIEEDFDDDREVEWDTEKAARIHIDIDDEFDMRVGNNEPAIYDDEQVDIRRLDEFIVSGMAVSGHIHGALLDRFDKVRIRYKDNEHQYIEMTNEAGFTYRW